MTDSKYCIGVDVSKYEVKIRDNSGTVDSILDYWNPDKSKFPIDFVIQRTSYGMRKDEFVDFLYKQCLKIPIRGGYHYFSTGIGWQRQLETILKSIEGKEYHFFAIDYERFYNNLNATSFAEMMELRKQLALVTKKKVMLYFNPDIYNTAMKPYNADAVINQYDNWIAQYPWKLFLNLDKGPSLPKGVTNYNFWQYGGADIASSAGYLDGFDYGSYRKGIDLNIFNGSLEELRVWAGVDDVIAPPIDTPEEPEAPVVSRYTGNVLSVAVLGLKIRSAPINGSQIGLLKRNDYFEADKLENGWFHITSPISGYISSVWTKYVDNGIDDTPIPPVDNPSSKPAISGPFYLLSDMDLGIKWEDRFENAKLTSYPATINVVGGKGTVQLSQSYLNQLKIINTPKQWFRMWTDEWGWHNKPHGEIGRVQQVTFAHSTVWVTGEDANYYYVDAYYNNETCPDLSANYDKYRINIFSIMGKNDAKNNGGIYYDDTGFVKTLLIANDRSEKLKIEKKYCKSMISVPLNCKVKTNGTNLYFRKFPVDGQILGSYRDGEIITILEFTKVSHRVWGRSKDGWIAMYLTDLDI